MSPSINTISRHRTIQVGLSAQVRRPEKQRGLQAALACTHLAPLVCCQCSPVRVDRASATCRQMQMPTSCTPFQIRQVTHFITTTPALRLLRQAAAHAHRSQAPQARLDLVDMSLPSWPLPDLVNHDTDSFVRVVLRHKAPHGHICKRSLCRHDSAHPPNQASAAHSLLLGLKSASLAFALPSSVPFSKLACAAPACSEHTILAHQALCNLHVTYKALRNSSIRPLLSQAVHLQSNAMPQTP